jgi:hypothetical protein
VVARIARPDIGVEGPNQRFCDHTLAADELWTLGLTRYRLTKQTSRTKSWPKRTTGANACAH